MGGGGILSEWKNRQDFLRDELSPTGGVVDRPRGTLTDLRNPSSIRAMRSPRLITYALVRDPRLPHLLRSLLADLWEHAENSSRRLIIAACYEEICDLDKGDQVEAVLVEVSSEDDLRRLGGACDAAPTARVIAVPSSLLLTPLVEAGAFLEGQIGGRATILRSLDEGGLREAFAA